MPRPRFPLALPWWSGLVLAGVVFVLVGYVAPMIAPSSRLTRPLVDGFAQLAWLFALPFALLSVGLLVRQALRRRLLDGQRDLDSIRDLPWQEFEHLVQEAFRRQGFRVAERGGAAPDGGVDLLLFKESRKSVVQCKRWRSKQVGVALIRDLYGAMTAEAGDEAIFVSSGDYTADARKFADGKPIQLINGPALLEMVRSVQRPTVEAASTGSVGGAPLVTPQNGDTPPACPRCGKAMVKRVARTGGRSGSSFWGCTGFPDCRGTRSAA